jgi:uncharacterized membrane protein
MNGMTGYWPSVRIGLVTGMRSMTTVAALGWASSLGAGRLGWVPSGSRARFAVTAAALGEMAGDKMPFAPDRRIPASFALRLLLGGLGGVMFANRSLPLSRGALAGVAGAVAGTLLGRAARGATTRSRADLVRALAEDGTAALLAVASVRAAIRDRERAARFR